MLLKWKSLYQTLDTSFLKIPFSCAQEDLFHCSPAEGDEGVEVMKSAEDGVIGGDGEDEDRHPDNEAPHAEKIDEGEGEHTHKLEGVA